MVDEPTEESDDKAPEKVRIRVMARNVDVHGVTRDKPGEVMASVADKAIAQGRALPDFEGTEAGESIFEAVKADDYNAMRTLHGTHDPRPTGSLKKGVLREQLAQLIGLELSDLQTED